MGQGATNRAGGLQMGLRAPDGAGWGLQEERKGVLMPSRLPCRATRGAGRDARTTQRAGRRPGGSVAAQPRPQAPFATRERGAGGRAHQLGFKGRAGLPGPLLPGSGALRQPGSTGERGTARATHWPPAGTLRRSPTEGLFLSPLPLFSI